MIEGNHPELAPNFGFLIRAMSVIAAVFVVLLAAAVTRRLHDRGKSGLIGLLPLPFLFFGLLERPGVFSGVSQDGGEPPKMFFLLFFNDFVYIGALLFLVSVLAGASRAGSNRFGPEPQR